jgi:uncharacterized protein with PQ loop repeat
MKGYRPLLENRNILKDLHMYPRTFCNYKEQETKNSTIAYWVISYFPWWLYEIAKGGFKQKLRPRKFEQKNKSRLARQLGALVTLHWINKVGTLLLFFLSLAHL